MCSTPRIRHLALLPSMCLAVPLQQESEVYHEKHLLSALQPKRGSVTDTLALQNVGATCDQHIT